MARCDHCDGTGWAPHASGGVARCSCWRPPITDPVFTQPTLPVAPSRSPEARHASHKAAVHAEARSFSQTIRYLQLIVERYPDGLTDHEAQARLEIPLASVCGRRGVLVEAGLIEAHGYRGSHHGEDNVVWRIRVRIQAETSTTEAA